MNSKTQRSIFCSCLTHIVGLMSIAAIGFAQSSDGVATRAATGQQIPKTPPVVFLDIPPNSAIPPAVAKHAPSPADEIPFPGEVLEFDSNGALKNPEAFKPQFKRLADGKVVATPEALGAQARYVTTGHDLVALLPDAAGGRTYVEFIFSGAVRSALKTGTVFYIDGAVIRFAAEPGDNGNGMAQLMVETADGGEGTWKATTLVTPFVGADELIVSPLLYVVLDHKSGTWSLHSGDLTLADSIPLLKRAGRPYAALTPGDAGQRAVVNKFAILSGPPETNLPIGPDGRGPILPDGTRLPLPTGPR